MSDPIGTFAVGESLPLSFAFTFTFTFTLVRLLGLLGGKPIEVLKSFFQNQIGRADGDLSFAKLAPAQFDFVEVGPFDVGFDVFAKPLNQSFPGGKHAAMKNEGIKIERHQKIDDGKT